jgi:hypothetical protein
MAEASDEIAGELSAARGAGLALALALAATLLMAAPVVMAPRERLFGTGAILGREDPNRDALIVIEQFRTGRVPSPYLQPLTDLPGRFLARLVGPVAAYNVLVLASFPFAAAAAYLLARQVLGSHLASMVSGLAYAFLPFHVAHAAGHAHVAQTQWLPLYFLALWRCADRPDLRRAALLAAAAAAVALSSFYFGLVAAVLSPVALVAYGMAPPRGPAAGRWRRLALTALVLGAVAAAGGLLVHRLAPAVLLRPAAFAAPRSDLFLYSAKWWSYFVPSADHPWAGPWVLRLTGRGALAGLVEQQVSLSLALLVLGAVPSWLWLRGRRDSRAVRAVPLLASLAGAAFLCSLAPEQRIGPLSFLRPSALLYEVAPMFRSYARFGAAVGLMIALLAGAGVARLWQDSKGRRAALLLLGLAAWELAPFPPWRGRDVLPTRAHRWLAAQPGTLHVVDCVPASRESDTLALRLLAHEVEPLGAPGIDDCAEPQLGEKLQALGYTHVLVRRESTTGHWLSAHPAPDGLGQGPVFEDAQILGVKAETPVAYIRTLPGFYPREYQGTTTWRWMGQTGGLRLVATRESRETSLEVELKAFGRNRTVEWSLDGIARGTVEVTTEWSRYDLPLGLLSPGEATLTLACRGPGLVANDILKNGDPRPLGLALGNWRIEQRQTLSREAPR